MNIIIRFDFSKFQQLAFHCKTLKSLFPIVNPFLPRGQLISKPNFLFLFERKNERNYFLISALASKNGSNQKSEGTLLVFNRIETFIF